MKINDRIVDVEERARLIALAHRLGCVVYQRNPETDTWFMYSDGKNIATVEFSARNLPMLASVHKPSRQVGTGYQMIERGEHITGELMQRALLTVAPQWASNSDHAAVVKWRDWNEFKNSSPWNAGYEEVTA